MNQIVLVLTYLLNGFLALLWLAMDHAPLVLLVGPLAWLGISAPAEQRSWTAASGVLALLAAAVAPMPAPVLMMVMAICGIGAIRLEQFNAAAARWNTVRGLALYALAGLGFRAYQDAAPLMASENPLLLQGQTYLSAIAAFAMYLIPLGFLALLAQSLWAHPPAPGNPADLTHAVRSRGKSE